MRKPQGGEHERTDFEASDPRTAAGQVEMFAGGETTDPRTRLTDSVSADQGVTTKEEFEGWLEDLEARAEASRLHRGR